MAPGLMKRAHWRTFARRPLLFSFKSLLSRLTEWRKRCQQRELAPRLPQGQGEVSVWDSASSLGDLCPVGPLEQLQSQRRVQVSVRKDSVYTNGFLSQAWGRNILSNSDIPSSFLPPQLHIFIISRSISSFRTTLPPSALCLVI